MLRAERNGEFRIDLFHESRDAVKVTLILMGDEESIEAAELCFDDIVRFVAVVWQHRVNNYRELLYLLNYSILPPYTE